MPKNNIVIAGGGFAGTAALKQLRRSKRALAGGFRLIVIDRKDSFEFLPMLPDIIGGWCRPESLSAPLDKLAGGCGCEFIKDEITGLDFSKKKVELRSGELEYEYLLLASGSETNFFGNEAAAGSCSRLESVKDALAIKEKLAARVESGGPVNTVIVGGGYTGIEIAANIHWLLREKRKNREIYIVEKSPDILGTVPEWMRNDVRNELNKLNIQIICRDSLAGYDSLSQSVLLESGREVKNAFCVWSAGVKASSFIEKTSFAKKKTRIRVNKDLTPEERDSAGVFAAGDAAYFHDKKTPDGLRMAVMFSLAEGRIAAANIVNSVLKKPLVQYNPIDLGFLIPMAHGKASGAVMGGNVRGAAGYLLHYVMCLYRSEAENRSLVADDLAAKHCRSITKRRMR